MKNRKNKAMKNYKTYTINWMVLVLLIVLSSCEKDFLEEYLRHHRVNINVRQVYPDDDKECKNARVQ